MKPQNRLRLVVATAAAAGIAVGAALGEVWLNCRRPGSEACVWGRAFLSLTIPAYLVVLGVPAGVAIYWLIGKHRPPRRGGTDPGVTPANEG